MSHYARAIALSLGLYVAWVVATYLLEGRIHTLLRPEATGARLLYTVVANLAIGTVGAVWLLRVLARARVISRSQSGFRTLPHALVTVLIGAGLGFLFYSVQQPPSWHPIVILNAFAQVLVVSVAEVLVCWAVVGAVTESALLPVGKAVAVIGASLVASILFGVYHVAHSPPFNSLKWVVFLSGIGLVTSAFYFRSRNVYGTIVLHNFFAILGVIQALKAVGKLAQFTQPQVPLLMSAALAAALLVAADALVLSRRNSSAAMAQAARM